MGCSAALPALPSPSPQLLPSHQIPTAAHAHEHGTCQNGPRRIAAEPSSVSVQWSNQLSHHQLNHLLKVSRNEQGVENILGQKHGEWQEQWAEAREGGRRRGAGGRGRPRRRRGGGGGGSRGQQSRGAGPRGGGAPRGRR